MNWTEGNLARHSRKRKHKDEFLRQREHFAKVRSGLLNPKTSISPPSISLFAQAPYSISHASSYAVQTMPPTSSRKRSRDAILSEDSQFFTNINVELPDPASFQKEQAEIEALSRKRQKLLMKSDWVGTDLQTPIQLEFSKPRTSLGNPWGSARSSCHSSQQKFRHLLGLNANNDQAVAAKAVTKNAMPVSRGQLKIRVGAREKMLGGSSSISPRSRSYRDVDAISNRDSGRRHRAHTRSSSSYKRAEQHRASGPGSDLQTHHNSDGSNHSRCPTASPFLYHPAPCRPTQPQLLRSQSSESETAASNVAQVGLRKPETPISQKLENEAWRAFVTGPSGCLAPSDLLSHDGGFPALLVSPGVSQLGRTEQALGPEVEQYASKSPVAFSFDGNKWNGDLPTQNNSIVLSSDHTSFEPFIEDSDGQNDSLVSLYGDLQIPDELRYDIPLDALPSQDVATALKESSSQSMARNVSISDPSVTSADDKAFEAVRKSTKEADDMSMLASPGSIHSSSEDMLNISCEPPFVVGKETVPEESTKEPDTQSHDQSHPQGIAEVGQVIERHSSSDENDLWRKFVFGESSDGFEKALEDARKQAAKSLRPSTTPASSSDGNMDMQESCLAEDGSEMTEHDSALSVEECQVEPNSTIDDFDHSSTNMTTTVSASYIATAGNSSPDPLAGDATQYSNTLARTDLATHGSSSSISNDPIELMDFFTRRSDVWSSTTSGGNRSSNPAHQQYNKERHRPEANLKFVQPKPFLGKKTCHIDKERQISLSMPQVRGKNLTSRRQKRRKDGRTAICNLPDFLDDPIEEFEDDIPSRGKQAQSLFGSLEVEKDF